ncbi:hypothetical protein RIF23_11620 [Lipingzhangella sp. LS1_29]|uniref:Uncharacterized protein n=1 Tax=Lipingzhangella rawalii TaxID=2055835 RepID=A0ABU2H7I9_9ACTN|nr:hypothetical protein [Lipingzhangella rawalii]MDS1270947.1 hypothetical protein [Lipingzhangella rawalii]
MPTVSRSRSARVRPYLRVWEYHRERANTAHEEALAALRAEVA